MKIKYPNSFLKLLLCGFGMVIIPLLLVFANATRQFDRLNQHSLANLSQAVETTRASKNLVDQLTSMERSARQYAVLHDSLFLTQLGDAHKGFQSALQTLTQQSIMQSQSAVLATLSKDESILYNELKLAAIDEKQLETFSALASTSAQLVKQSNALIDQESSRLQEQMKETKRLLFMQTLGLVPLAILLAGIITWLIARPLKQMDEAIEWLGQAKYDKPIEIDGPGGLRKLAKRLNWLRNELSNLHQQKQRFFQQASHELKTPLTAIREASALLQEGTAGALSKQQAEIVGILSQSSLQLQGMIQNLLKLTEAEFSESKLHASQIVLKSLIEKILQDHHLTLTQKQITPSIEIAEIVLSTDIEKLKLILDNLISNAIKFTAPIGTLRITAHENNTSVNIEVIDNGPGISKSDQAYIFDAFYRGKNTVGGPIKGSGLGLYITKQAVNSLNGEIELQPTETGAHIVVRIPKIMEQ